MQVLDLDGREVQAAVGGSTQRSDGERSGLARPVAREAEAREAKQRHRPGRGFGNGTSRIARNSEDVIKIG
jgi:hypothetical protein